ncbi:hypothetical protein [Staphylococcus pasteuri]|uniref:hypothetical protein n=1 Tax=Staphylococcus pasteuri TaxID=45972 RepID=UPI000D36F1E9|nr:hypothetical protein [Staphylococcus pasteuri]MBM6506805.1 hypothetical protein [Staphylococcus pasteuri]PTU88105.1 hypothetical protein BUZ62_00900 [Staphylococcus pasteuri]QQT21429.1 hypothetical protein I6J08_05820 [Staphylococcus pasteuri]
MVKIKRKVEMTLPELIQWGWDTDIKEKAFYSNVDGGSVYFDKVQNVSIEHETAKNETFTVEVEEEITEDMVLPSIVVVRTQYFPNNGKTVNVAKINDVSINKIINTQPNNSKYEVHEIYLMNEVGIGELLWKDGAMVE